MSLYPSESPVSLIPHPRKGSYGGVCPQAQQVGGITPEARRVVEEILASSASKKPTGRHDLSGMLIAAPTEILKRDPYNVRALIGRGQSYYLGARMFGPLRFREALNDFEKAAQINKSLADPHFGIGTVLYQVALFDLADRGLYKINEPGGLIFDKETVTMRIRHPRLQLFVDQRNRIVLQAALDEFQAGRRLQQLYHQGGGGTIIFFAPQDVENRIRSIRTLMSYEPLFAPDNELIMNFTSFLEVVEPGGMDKLLKFGRKQSD